MQQDEAPDEAPAPPVPPTPAGPLDGPTLDRLLNGFGTAIGDAIRNTADADRRANAINVQRIANSVSRPPQEQRGDGFGGDRTETVAAIQRSQTDAMDWLKSNHFSPEDITVQAWVQELQEQLTSPFCKDVMRFRGIESYKRQSNALAEKLDELERSYRQSCNDCSVDHHRSERSRQQRLRASPNPGAAADVKDYDDPAQRDAVQWTYVSASDDWEHLKPGY